jgi:hypothetical protein
MEFITEEVKTSLGLSEEQINGLTPVYNDHIATQKQTWDLKANENAEGILNGAATKISEVTKVARNQGEKVADYIVRAGNEHFSTLKNELEVAKSEYAQKLKDFKGDDATKEELQKAKDELDKAKQTLATFDDIKAKADKLEPLETEYKTMKLQIAFQSVKPNFPETVNSYEAKAKWDDFVKGITDKNTIELVDGEAIVIDKENEHKRSKLKDLVEKDEEITKLLQGRNQGGTGGKPTEKVKIDGVPFEVPQNASSEERSKAIKDYLLKEGIALTSPEYSKKFSEYNTLILSGGKK